ncbi:Oidioi.mRNA.OKI2018_I69.chr2.g6090.t1.cds [Oikopleura dioica]|uniref:Oidioi.mRNA.OKI2018_I69.chr2.g6090.t1.cds n=1 Tax=Oikopleura dioica TaxID=34765 RepID=A0ABN7TBC5_OIKDI|nr:Oidioi.mRNA.OKI2018_I69.chr2.g6090.t1.cds [Oikopleura dioica]
MLRIVDFGPDIHDKESKKADQYISHGSASERREILDGIKGFSIFDADDVEDLERNCTSMIERGGKGKFRVKSIDISRLRMKYFFGHGYDYGGGKGSEKFFNPKDISPIPEWIYESIIEKMEKTGIVDKNWINSVVINDYEPGGFIVQHQDPPHLFERPIFILTLFSDSALSFGCNLRFDRTVEPVEVTASDPILRLPMQRGIITSFEGMCMNEIKHCVRPVDTKERRVAIILRRICEDGPVLEPLTNGESLRNFDKKLHKKVQKRCEKMLASKILPYERSFHLVEVKRETEKSKAAPKEKVKEPWRKQPKPKKESKKRKEKLKKKGVGTFELDRPIEKDENDKQWNFGDSPERVSKRVEWSSDDEQKEKNKRIGKTGDMADLIYDFHHQDKDLRDMDIKTIERKVHMQKSRKQRGREFRDKINSKFGFKTSVANSDSDSSDSSDSSEEVRPKKTRISKFTF